jgi:hypothetical protein
MTSRDFLAGLPTEFVGGRWSVPTDDEPQAVVTYATTPSPETGHVGWCWWALGKMGEAASYDLARAAAESVVERVGQKAKRSP